MGGIFFDDLATADLEADFAFVRAVGLGFPRYLSADLIRRHMAEPWTAEQKRAQLVKRGRYVEFNLLYDRGTRFGIETGGNPRGGADVAAPRSSVAVTAEPSGRS